MLSIENVSNGTTTETTPAITEAMKPVIAGSLPGVKTFCFGAVTVKFAAGFYHPDATLKMTGLPIYARKNSENALVFIFQYDTYQMILLSTV